MMILFKTSGYKGKIVLIHVPLDEVLNPIPEEQQQDMPIHPSIFTQPRAKNRLQLFDKDDEN